MCLAQGPQRSDAGEARTRGPSVSSQVLFHLATALPWCLVCGVGVHYVELASSICCWRPVCGIGVQYVELVSSMWSWCPECGVGVQYVELVSRMLSWCPV